MEQIETKQNKNFAGIYRDEVNKLSGLFRLFFIHLLISCNHSDNPEFVFDNKPLPLKRGQLITSFRKLAEDTGISLQSTRTYLKNLEKLGKLTHQSTQSLTNRATLITIVDIDKYLVAPRELTSELTHSPTSDQHTPNKPLTTNNNDNNDQEQPKKEKQINVETLFSEFWNLYPNKKSKPKALLIYKKIYKDHEAIIEGLKIEIEYRKWAEQQIKKGVKVFVPFWKHPTTWLNQQCWLDEYTGEFAKQIQRIKRNEFEKDIEAKEKIIKEAESKYHAFQVKYFNEKYGESGWNYMKTVMNPELLREVFQEFEKQYPEVVKLLPK